MEKTAEENMEINSIKVGNGGRGEQKSKRNNGTHEGQRGGKKVSKICQYFKEQRLANLESCFGLDLPPMT